MHNDEPKRPIRILHIVGGMNTGGVETWLMHVLRGIDRERYKFDFLVHTDKTCFYDEEIKSLGCRIIPCQFPKRPLQYAWNFRRILKQNGPYDVVHSHVHHFSGFTLLIAKWRKVPVRIAHSHSNTVLNERRAGIWRNSYLWITKWLIRQYATTGLACSRLAAISLFGKNWESDLRWQILYCGVDLGPFMNPVDRFEVRGELGIPDDAFVLGHVGRFSEPKNHSFLLNVFTEVLHREPNSCLLLVGDGLLRESIKQKAQHLGLMDKIIFAGVRLDVPRLMLGAMDVFVFPSLWEGLPVVLIEAQSANLPCVYSKNITEEVAISRHLMHCLSLDDSASTWAEVLLRKKDAALVHEKKISKDIINGSFNIKMCLDQLKDTYIVSV